MKQVVFLFCLALLACDEDRPKPVAQSDSAVTSGPDLSDAAPSDAAVRDAAHDGALDASRDAEGTRDAEPARDAGDAQANGVRIGAAGGSFGNDALTVTIPAGALTSELAFSVVGAANGAPGARGGTWELGPDATTFAVPARLTFKAGVIASGVPLADLTIMTASAGGWVALEGVTHDVATQTVSAPLAHLSPYGLVFVPPMPVGCPPDACANGSCVPGASDWSCRCNPNFAYAPTTKTCVDEPNCTATACGHGTCIEGVGSYTCNCDAGYVWDAVAKTCFNPNNCAGVTCANGVCVDGLGSYDCLCNAGYDYDAATKTCVNHNDCKPEYCAGGVCMDLVNDYVCASCPYEGSGTKSCDGADNCVGVTCANGVCIDGNNDYTCSCNVGFDATGKACVPHNDCPAGACANGTCIDQHLDYACQCNPGYDAQGKSCIKHQYCAGNPCGVGGTCNEQPTSYACSCNAPYTAQNGTCVNLCANVSCVGGTCSAGVCTCPPTHDLINGTCVLKDPCAGVVCGLGGTCNNGVCSCPTMFDHPEVGPVSTHTKASADGRRCECTREPHWAVESAFVVYEDCDQHPANGCETHLNGSASCGFCGSCLDLEKYSIVHDPSYTPVPVQTPAGPYNIYKVSVPGCPATITAGSMCGADDPDVWANTSGIWSAFDCLATATGTPQCVPKASH